jgi:hypothetical protein
MSELFEIVNNNITTDKAYETVLLKINKHAINEKDDDFIKLHGEEKVKKDQEYVEKMERIFKVNNKSESSKKATILEYIIYEQSELGEWLGKKAVTQKTSRTDDIRNGIDIAVEFEKDTEDSEYLGLAIDVSFGDELMKKFQRIKDEIDSGKLAKLEYFRSQNIAKEITDVPRVIVAVDGKTLNELIELWSEKSEDSKTKLAAHPVQIQILNELFIQLKIFEQYAREVVKKDELADIYKRDLLIVRNLLRDKKLEFSDFKGEMQDSGYDRVREGLSLFEKEIENTPSEKGKLSEAEMLYKKHPYLKKKAS